MILRRTIVSLKSVLACFSVKTNNAIGTETNVSGITLVGQYE